MSSSVQRLDSRTHAHRWRRWLNISFYSTIRFGFVDVIVLRHTRTRASVSRVQSGFGNGQSISTMQTSGRRVRWLKEGRGGELRFRWGWYEARNESFFLFSKGFVSFSRSSRAFMLWLWLDFFYFATLFLFFKKGDKFCIAFSSECRGRGSQCTKFIIICSMYKAFPFFEVALMLPGALAAFAFWIMFLLIISYFGGSQCFVQAKFIHILWSIG